jgi:zinc/manganese transport system ATP-binding protein
VNAVELDRVTLAYGERVVLADISLAIREREFVAVLGPNGAGKTTLFRAILGLVPPHRGIVRVLGKPVRRGNRGIGYVPQQRSGIGELRLSGRDFVACTREGHRWGLPHLGAAARREVDRALDLVEAGALAKRSVGEMSGGERQRLLLAQALLGSPRLLLLDEPLISLDMRHQQSAVALVRRLHRELGIAVLFSAHELNPLLGSIDRVLYLGAGHAELGEIDAVITGPVLSRLYGAPIEVVRLGGRIFVLSGDMDIQHAEHCRHAEL